MIESEIFYIIWGAAGICMVCSYFMGKSAGYKNLQFEIASSIIDIHSEKEEAGEILEWRRCPNRPNRPNRSELNEGKLSCLETA